MYYNKKKLVLIFTCTALISSLSLPGNIYVTSEFLCGITGIQIPGISINMSTQRECYRICDIDSIVAVTHSRLPFITANTLVISFYNNEKLLYLTPMAINRTFLIDLILLIKYHFHE